MFIVNQINDKIIEMKKVEIVSRYPKKIQDGLDEIYNRRITKVYNYGSSENCMRAIKEEQREFLIGKEKEYIILVNGLDFATYSSEQKAQEEFYEIANTVKENKNIYFLNEEGFKHE